MTTSPIATRGILCKVHIGGKMWSSGQISFDETKQHFHMVVYGPGDERITRKGKIMRGGRISYHLDDSGIQYVIGDMPRWAIERRDAIVDPAKLKNYILTSILDKRVNGCFDLIKINYNRTPVAYRLTY